MFGSIGGSIGGTIYFAIYQVCGMLIAFRLFKKEKPEVKILIGSVMGNIALMWFPIICSFFADFTVGSHIGGLIILACVTFLVLYFVKDREYAPATAGKGGNAGGNSGNNRNRNNNNRNNKNAGRNKNNNKNSNANKNKKKPAKKVNYFKEYPVLFVAIPLLIYFFILLWNHVLLKQADGTLYTGQATYGDMNMHLGFITSIAKQHTFPPTYSIFPDARLSYPFLSDSISSSVYIWGSSLRYAYILPMVFAVIHVFAGMYALAVSLLKNKWKAFLAFVLFFVNGGLGFIYFFSGKYSFTQLMNDFYVTPANLVQEGVKWTNIIVDMLLPQRATLFGWSVLFTTIFIIYKARTTKNKKYFITAAVMAGALPMIHTHSFLALGIICFGWLIMDLTKTYSSFDNKFENDKTKPVTKILIALAIAAAMAIMTILTYVKIAGKINDKLCFDVAIGGVLLVAVFGIYVFIRNLNKEKTEIFKLYMIFLGIVLVLALPQLFGWTFRQVGNAGIEMLRGHFNWTNDGDITAPYIIFYFKNLGIMGVLIIPALIMSGKKNLSFIFPTVIIWFIAQFVLFQPNPYDNNKLLLITYLFMCIIVSDVLLDVLKAIPKAVKYCTVAVVLVVAMLSAVLTMAREVYSGMPGHNIGLYNDEALKAAEFIEENIPAKATFLTDTNNDNLVAAITGRNIVCGSSSYLYYHGFSTFEREDDIRKMYTDPLGNEDLFKKYNVQFIYVSNAEYMDYEGLNEDALHSRFNCVYSTGSIRIYQVTDKQEAATE